VPRAGDQNFTDFGASGGDMKEPKKCGGVPDLKDPEPTQSE